MPAGVGADTDHRTLVLPFWASPGESSFQPRPFQCSTKVRFRAVLPTAHMSFADTAVIPFSVSSPVGLGGKFSAQKCPFQCSARVNVTVPVGVCTSYQPAAHTSLGPAEVRLRNALVKLSAGIFTTDQAWPSQCSDSGAVSNRLVPVSPVAHTSSGPATVTPLRLSPYLPGLGVGTTRQRVPSQCSASVSAESPGSLAGRSPTAHTSPGEATASALAKP